MRPFFSAYQLLADPAKHLLELVEFCGLRASLESVARIAENARTSRGNAYRGKSDLEMFAAAKAARLGKYGY